MGWFRGGEGAVITRDSLNCSGQSGFLKGVAVCGSVKCGMGGHLFNDHLVILLYIITASEEEERIGVSFGKKSSLRWRLMTH